MANKGFAKGSDVCKFLRINSADRVADSSSSDAKFSIDFGQNLQQVKQLSICSVTFNNVFYNVYSTSIKYNNRFRLTLVTSLPSNQSWDIVIPPGHYTAYSLIDAINAAINTATGGTLGFTFTLDPSTNIVTMALTSGPVGLLDVFFSRAVPDTVKTRQDFWPFGLLGDDTVNPPGGGVGTFHFDLTDDTRVFANMPSLNEPAYIYILSAAMAPANSFDEKGSFSNVLIAIPVTAPWLGRNVFDCKVDQLCEIIYSPSRNLDRVDFELVDHDLDPLDLHGTQLEMQLRVWLDRF